MEAKGNPNLIKNGGKGSKIGKFLRGIDKEDILGAVSVATNIASGNWLGAVGAIKTLIDTDLDMTAEQKAEGNKIIELEYADIAGARLMYTKTDHKTADEIATNIIKKNLPLIIGLVLINILSVWLLKDQGELIAIISNFIGITIGYLFSERQQVINFFFGSSIGSKDKTNLLNKN